MVSTPQRRWLTLAAVVMLVSLAIGPAGAFLHGHEAGSVDDHCAVCHAHHASTIDTPQLLAGRQLSTHAPSPTRVDGERDVLDGVHLSRGPPRLFSL